MMSPDHGIYKFDITGGIAARPGSRSARLGAKAHMVRLFTHARPWALDGRVILITGLIALAIGVPAGRLWEQSLHRPVVVRLVPYYSKVDCGGYTAAAKAWADLKEPNPWTTLAARDISSGYKGLAALACGIHSEEKQ